MLLLLAVLGATASLVPGRDSGIELKCTNDFEDSMTCYFHAENCAEHRVSLQGNDSHKSLCGPLNCEKHTYW